MVLLEEETGGKHIAELGEVVCAPSPVGLLAPTFRGLARRKPEEIVCAPEDSPSSCGGFG